MKPQFLLPFAFLVILIFQACKKADLNGSQKHKQALVDSAITYYKIESQLSGTGHSSSFNFNASRKPEWTKAQLISLSVGQALLIPLSYSRPIYVFTNIGKDKLLSISDLTHLLVYRTKSGKLQEQVITFLPDTVRDLSRSNHFTGIARVEDLNGNILHQYHYYKNGNVREFRLDQLKLALSSGQHKKLVPTTFAEVAIIIDIYLEGYNYAAGDYGGGSSWSEYIGSYTIEIPGDGTSNSGDPSSGDYEQMHSKPGGGSGDGSNGPNNSRNPVDFGPVMSGDNIIANINDYNKCFTNYGGSDHTYTVQLCVSQPVPGKRDAWAPQTGGISGSSAAGNPVRVGHTFLIFSEKFSDHAITRNVGFYPKNMAAPWSTSDQGQLNDNEGDDYNISLTIAVTNSQFFQMLNYVSQGNNPGYLYDLNSNNCTTFALNTLSAGDVIIHSTIGTWALDGIGYDPGDLGEDIRNMPLTDNMTRSTEVTSHPNTGTCY